MLFRSQRRAAEANDLGVGVVEGSDEVRNEDGLADVATVEKGERADRQESSRKNWLESTHSQPAARHLSLSPAIEFAVIATMWGLEGGGELADSSPTKGIGRLTLSRRLESAGRVDA